MKSMKRSGSPSGCDTEGVFELGAGDAVLGGDSPSSLRRYAAGARRAPDSVVGRLHTLALLVADLAGAYNDYGIRRWFARPRTVLEGRSPEAVLAGEWDPDGPEAARVRRLATGVVGASDS